MNKYEKLKEDLKVAVKEAKHTAEITDEGGTCNFDSCFIVLPRWNEEKVLSAAKEAGCNASKWKFLDNNGFMFFAPVYAQGNCRTAQAEKMCEIMKSKGYDAHMYYQLD